MRPLPLFLFLTAASCKAAGAVKHTADEGTAAIKEMRELIPLVSQFLDYMIVLGGLAVLWATWKVRGSIKKAWKATTKAITRKKKP